MDLNGVSNSYASYAAEVLHLSQIHQAKHPKEKLQTRKPLIMAKQQLMSHQVHQLPQLNLRIVQQLSHR